jgi:hypothetical protein
MDASSQRTKQRRDEKDSLACCQEGQTGAHFQVHGKGRKSTPALLESPGPTSHRSGFADEVGITQPCFRFSVNCLCNVTVVVLPWLATTYIYTLGPLWGQGNLLPCIIWNGRAPALLWEHHCSTHRLGTWVVLFTHAGHHSVLAGSLFSPLSAFRHPVYLCE